MSFPRLFLLHFFLLNCCQALFASVIRSQSMLSWLHYENTQRSSSLLIKHYALLQYCMEMYREPAALFPGRPLCRRHHCQMKYCVDAITHTVYTRLKLWNAASTLYERNLLLKTTAAATWAVLSSVKLRKGSRNKIQSILQSEMVDEVIVLSNTVSYVKALQSFFWESCDI